jgi:hypothetical protein
MYSIQVTLHSTDIDGAGGLKTVHSVFNRLCLNINDVCVQRDIEETKCEIFTEKCRHPSSDSGVDMSD